MNCRSRAPLTVLAVAVFMGTVWQPARAELFVSGSSFTVEGTNSPDTFSSPATLSSGVQSLDSGKLLLTVSDVPAADGAEWLIFSYQTASGGPLSQATQDWALGELGLQATVPVKAIAGFAQFDDNGTLLNPTAAIFPDTTVAPNPIPGMSGIGQLTIATFSFPAGPLPLIQTFIDPFSILNEAGIDPSLVTSFSDADEWVPQTPVTAPEPGSLTLIAGGLLAFGIVRRLQTMSAQDRNVTGHAK